MSLAAIILIAWCGLSLIAVGVSLIFIFEKAGQNGIDALIPGKNSITTARITATKAPVTGAFVSAAFLALGFLLYFIVDPRFTLKGRLILSLLPFTASMLVTSAIVCTNMAEVFDKKDLFGVGMFFLPFVFWPMLAFGESHYLIDPSEFERKEREAQLKKLQLVKDKAQSAEKNAEGGGGCGVRSWLHAFKCSLLGQPYSQLDYLRMPWIGKWLFRLGRSLHNIPIHIWNGIKKLGKLIWNKVILGIVRFFKNTFLAIATGSWKTRVSCVIMGFGSFARKQWLRGLLFLLFEIAFFVYMFTSGFYYIGKLSTLGTIRTMKANRVTTYGDNSFQILLYGVLTLFFILAFIYTWYINIKQNKVNDDLERGGHKIKTTRDDLRAMADEQFHKTLLALPTAGVTIFTILPIFFMILVAFTNFDKNHQHPSNLFTWVGWDNFYEMLTTHSMDGIDSDTLSFDMTKDFEGLQLRARAMDEAYVDVPEWPQMSLSSLADADPDAMTSEAKASLISRLAGYQQNFNTLGKQLTDLNTALVRQGIPDGFGSPALAERVKVAAGRLTSGTLDRMSSVELKAFCEELAAIDAELKSVDGKLAEYNEPHHVYSDPVTLSYLDWTGMNLDWIPASGLDVLTAEETEKLTEEERTQHQADRTAYINRLSTYLTDLKLLSTQLPILDAQLKANGIEDGYGCEAMAETAKKAVDFLGSKSGTKQLEQMNDEEFNAFEEDLLAFGKWHAELNGKLKKLGKWSFAWDIPWDEPAANGPGTILVLTRQSGALKVSSSNAVRYTWQAQTNGTSNWVRADQVTGGMGSTFVSVLIWTLVWAIFATFLNYFLGMLVAIMINKKGIRLKKVWRTILVMTIAIPQFVSLLYVSKMFAPDGLINTTLQRWDWISGALPFWTDSSWARVTIIMINIWIGIPYLMLIATGILMNIPADLYESARIDGANGFQMYRKITLPYMLFVTGPYLLTSFTGNINNFNVIYLLNGGKPLSMSLQGNAGSTDLLITWLYKMTVSDSNYKMAAVIGILVFVVTAVINLIVYNMIPSVKNEEDFQ